MPKAAAAPKASTLCRRRADCRLCGGKRLQLAFALTPTPPANAFVPEGRRAQAQPVFPLEVFLCEDCAHLQLRDVVDPAVLFEDYVYVSGTSPVFVKHFEGYAKDLLERYALKPGSLIVDIGSNDGTFLRFFKDAGMKVLGVDPAKDIARRATESGIETWPEFFSPALARRILKERGPAALVAGNNVFAHADDLRGFADGVKELLSPQGVFAFEASYLADVVSKTLFDTVYHEHLAYHAVRPLVPFFKSRGLELAEALKVDTHGGSLRGIVWRLDRQGPRCVTVAERLAEEEKLGLHRLETYKRFAGDIDKVKAELSSLLRKLKVEGKTVAGFGAPAKMTTLMYHFGLGPETVAFVVDDSPLKQGLFTPGHHIPVLPSAAVYERKPDYLLILAWNFAEPIMAKHEAFRKAGGRFIVPLPEVRVV